MSGPITAPITRPMSAHLLPSSAIQAGPASRARFDFGKYVDFQANTFRGQGVPTIYPHAIPKSHTSSLRMHLKRGPGQPSVSFQRQHNRWDVAVDRSSGFVSRSGSLDAVIDGRTRDLRLTNTSGQELFVRWFAGGQELHRMPFVDRFTARWELPELARYEIDRIAVTGATTRNLSHGQPLLYFDREMDAPATGAMDVPSAVMPSATRVSHVALNDYANAVRSSLRAAPQGISEYVRPQNIGWDKHGNGHVALGAISRGQPVWAGQLIGHIGPSTNPKQAGSILAAIANHVVPFKAGRAGAGMPAVDIHIDLFSGTREEVRRFETRYDLAAFGVGTAMRRGTLLVLGSAHMGTATQFGVSVGEGVMGSLSRRDAEVRTRQPNMPTVQVAAFGDSQTPNDIHDALMNMHSYSSSTVPPAIASLISYHVVEDPRYRRR